LYFPSLTCSKTVKSLRGASTNFRLRLKDMPDDSAAQRFKANQKRLPVHLQAPFEGLKRQQAKVKRLLSTQAGQEAFLKDPVAAMEAVGVKIDASLRKVLLSGQGRMKNLKGAGTVMFANGSSVTPNVRVTITL
jgi:hypothetical protein